MALDLTTTLYNLIAQVPGGSTPGLNFDERLQLAEAILKKLPTLTNSYTETTADFVQPAVGATVAVEVETTVWMVIGQTLLIPAVGVYTVSAIADTTNCTLTLESTTVIVGATVPSGSAVAITGPLSDTYTIDVGVPE